MIESILMFIKNHIEIVSAIAFLLSIANFIYTYRKDKDQKQKWDSLNLPRLVVRDIDFTKWGSLKKADFRKISWGYTDPFAVAPTKNSIIIDEETLLIPVSIVAIHSKTDVIQDIKAITVNELLVELQRRGYNPQDYKIAKLYRIVFEIINNGATTASEVLIRAEMNLSDTTLEALPTQEPLILKPGEHTWSFTEWESLLTEPFPNELQLEIEVSFKDIHGKISLEKFKFTYDRNVASFRRI